MNTALISRRRFAQLLSVGTAAAVVRPVISFASSPSEAAASTVIRLSANENAYGPSPMALKAMTDDFNLACRYPDEQNDVLIEKLARINGVNRDQILLGDGSSEILKLCAETFTNNERDKLVAADPTFEAILNNASVNGAEVVKIPLTRSFAHDLPRMMAAASEGLVYVCNPNNPTASITPKTEFTRVHRQNAAGNDDSRGRSLLPLRRQSRLRERGSTGQRSSEPDCLANVFKNLRHGGITLRLLRGAKGHN